jgi:hypothetical protein
MEESLNGLPIAIFAPVIFAMCMQKHTCIKRHTYSLCGGSLKITLFLSFFLDWVLLSIGITCIKWGEGNYHL